MSHERGQLLLLGARGRGPLVITARRDERSFPYELDSVRAARHFVTAVLSPTRGARDQRPVSDNTVVNGTARDDSAVQETAGDDPASYDTVVDDAGIVVTELAMKVCGGAAFRKELGVERRFRDARASRVMAPTTDALLDFIGRAINGLPLL